LNKTTGLFL